MEEMLFLFPKRNEEKHVNKKRRKVKKKIEEGIITKGE